MVAVGITHAQHLVDVEDVLDDSVCNTYKYKYKYSNTNTNTCTCTNTNTFLGSYDRDPWSEQRCAHRRSDTIFSGGGTNDKDG